MFGQHAERRRPVLRAAGAATIASAAYSAGKQSGIETVSAAPGAGTLEQAETSGHRYVMRQKLLSIGDDFFIKNAQGERVLMVDGKALRIRGVLFIRDMQGNELLKIQEKLLPIRETMTIHRGSDVAASVHKALVGPLRDRFQVEVPGGEDMRTVGNIFDHEYRMEQDGQNIAEISKRWFRLRDAYGVDIAPGQDDVLILTISICIDQMVHGGR